MPQILRSEAKPECISAAVERAQARTARSAGQTPGCRSARYSAIASESHTTVSPSCRQGTLPLGEKVRNVAWVSARSSVKGVRCSRKGMPSAFISTQGRSDHEE